MTIEFYNFLTISKQSKQKNKTNSNFFGFVLCDNGASGGT